MATVTLTLFISISGMKLKPRLSVTTQVSTSSATAPPSTAALWFSDQRMAFL